ncbi:DNA repair protein XRCC3-like isoform X2 [Tubulanus polymorphus]|uniref:DNA repair protein XRCC3-like isoform X2 n=1 Tax=Tubulanus polymorphus TaxID=672921 RepID=UPI003DA2561B
MENKHKQDVIHIKLTSPSHILSLSAPDLERKTKLSSNDVAILQKTVANSVLISKPMTTAHEIFHTESDTDGNRLNVGCPILNAFLEGGILRQGITEIVGESASGKTQLCMQLCLTVQLPVKQGGLDGGAVYLCTEDAFPNKRLHQLIHYFQNKDLFSTIDFGDHIYIEHAADLEGLLYCIEKRIPLLLARGAIKLIVIDSIAALFRVEYSINETVQRAKHLNTLGSILHRMNNRYNIPIVCVNQVTASFTDRSKKCVPALGLTWANLVTTRIQLSRTTRHVTTSPVQMETCLRTIEVLFAPHLPNRLCHYVINDRGVEGLS